MLDESPRPTPEHRSDQVVPTWWLELERDDLPLDTENDSKVWGLRTEEKASQRTTLLRFAPGSALIAGGAMTAVLLQAVFALFCMVGAVWLVLAWRRGD